MNVGLVGRFAEYAAAVHTHDQPVIVFGTARQASEARLRLARVGVETVIGAVASSPARDPGLLATASRVSGRQAAALIASVVGLQVVDVRGPGEFAGGSLPGAVNLPLPRLRTDLSLLDPARPVLVTCASGYRSIAAASVLEAMGFADVSDLLGGWGGWQDSVAADERTPSRS